MKFIEVMEKRHSSRDFKKDEVSEDTLREIVRIAGMSPSWENSQPWNVYIATGETLETIREAWIAENDKKIKGSADMNPGHRTNFSERGQKNMADFMDAIGKFDDDEDLENFNHVQHILFNSPAVVYLTLP
ncbi:nitroreductase family protein, partial [uncultured Methanobrevibacter sp.]